MSTLKIFRGEIFVPQYLTSFSLEKWSNFRVLEKRNWEDGKGVAMEIT